MRATARYDEFADWYEQWTGDGLGLIAEHLEMLPTLDGASVLDIACGQGRLTRQLARRGANAAGVDLSAAMLAKARSAGPPAIRYIQADVSKAPTWWDGQPFDGCTCDLALMDIDNLPGALATVATVLRPGGWFVASLVHPCFPGNDAGRSSWPPDGGYDTEGWWTSADHNPNGVRVRVGSTHRKLSTLLNGLLEAGLAPEYFVEPPAPIPTYLLWRCRKVAPPSPAPK